MKTTLKQLAQWAHGSCSGTDVAVTGITIDSRMVQPGDVFVAIAGDNFNGHDFLAKAKEQGAIAVVVSQPQNLFANAVQVADTRAALGRIAAGWRQHCAVQSIAVTGNSGKTTVKEMLAHLFGDAQCLATAGNFNNEIGVPLTLLRLSAQHDYGVFELGANHKGEIAWTASLVQPEVGVITNVTGAHLEGFGSLEGIANAKAELIPAVQKMLVLNKEGGFYDTFADVAKAACVPVCTVSMEDPTAEFFAQGVECASDGVSFQCVHQEGTFAISVPLPGKHQVANALQAIAVARYYDFSWAHIKAKLASLPSVPGRLQRLSCGKGVVFDDTYNANPGSVAAAVQYLATQPAPRLFVFGGMGELGSVSEAEHARIGDIARDEGIEALITVGAMAAPTAQAFGEASVQCETHADVTPLARHVLQQGGSVLVKGSRSTKMETVVKNLFEQQKEDH